MITPYELIYYTGVPARGEHIRLVLEETSAPYGDTGSLGMDKFREVVTHYLAGD
ncbi:hypothetical protein F4809DRAFT_618751 [Biscogniauxia mediterranea]|nr:hypothetical protein F4809DRAFT_618751 [Biscogniauxia mediterranea]